jgi:type II secretory pathway pseudopilin PulG
MKEKRKEKRDKREEKGDILVVVLVFAAVAVTVLTGLANWGVAMLKGIRTVQTREQTFQIAEAGIDYYRWHLAQLPTDYKDGTNNSGPYYHKFYDKDGNLIGSYALSITPPPNGSTKVIITSTATTTANPTVKRIIQATMAIPSLAQYSVVADDYLRFGAGTAVYGPVTSNYGIRFDGTAYNIISSAQNTYTDPDTGQTEWGVWTSVGSGDPQPPTAESARPDVFTAGRQFPVPAIDFPGLTVNLQQLQTAAQSGGKDWAPSGAQGYHMVMNPNGTYNMYKINSLQSVPSNCTNSNNQTQWGTWSIKVNNSGQITTGSGGSNSQTQVNGPNGDHSWPNPGNGIIFVEDDLWIDGQINNARLTIAAGTFPDSPGNEPNITIGQDNGNPSTGGNLLYTYFDGRDTIGLIAQGNINVGLLSEDVLTVDAALVAENGRIGRFYYGSNCTVNGTDYHVRSTINLNGMIATNNRYGFAYTDNTGYTNRNITYDSNLLYAPPPSFPLASSQYQMISWDQVQ